MTIDLRKTLIAGTAGTLAVDLTGLLLTGNWWDIPNLLATKLSVGLPIGAALHYGIGFTLAFIYAAVAPSLPGNRWTKALSYVVAETVLGVYLFMFPLLGAGAFGLGLGAAVPVISMVRHLAFGGVLGWVYPVSTSLLPAQRVHSN